jgi:hypothetical protein
MRSDRRCVLVVKLYPTVSPRAESDPDGLIEVCYSISIQLSANPKPNLLVSISDSLVN